MFSNEIDLKAKLKRNCGQDVYGGEIELAILSLLTLIRTFNKGAEGKPPVCMQSFGAGEHTIRLRLHDKHYDLVK
jgi:hypothetical protein